MQVASCQAVGCSDIVRSVALFWGGGKRIKSERQVDRLARRAEWLEGERERGKQQAQIRRPPGHPEIQKKLPSPSFPSNPSYPLPTAFLLLNRTSTSVCTPDPGICSTHPRPSYA